jgi:hypothetical protein
MLKTPVRLVSMTSFHCWGVILWNGASRVMPALLISTSTGPRSASTWAMPFLAGVVVGDRPLVGLDAGLSVKAFAASSLPA